MTTKKLTRTAIILALVVVFQSLRVFLPLPGVASNFVIGSLVNAVLLTASSMVGIWSGMIVAGITPVVAYLQGMLPLPIFIVPIAIGNIIYVVLFQSRLQIGFWPATGLAALGKTIFLYASFQWLLVMLVFPPKPAAILLMAMSWPQLITAVMGAILAKIVMVRLEK